MKRNLTKYTIGLLCNLTYVKVDRDKARSHWWNMVEFSQLPADVYSVNRSMVVTQKALAGIIGHRQTRGFVIHRLKERGLLRKLKRTEECVFCGVDISDIHQQNNPAPVSMEGRCCAHCNMEIVLPARLKRIREPMAAMQFLMQ